MRKQQLRAFREVIAYATLAPASLAMHCVAQQPSSTPNPTIAEVQRGFATPPDDARPMMRWWWFGPAVVKPELEREILAMKAGGIGGFEIQPVYPLALDDKTTGFHNYPYLSDEFLGAVRFAAETARTNGMRVDMTLASGWPYGGPQVPADQAAASLRMNVVDIPAGAQSFAAPALENGERMIAMFVGNGTSQQYDSSGLNPIDSKIASGRVELASNPAPRVALCFITSRTGQQVKRAAVGAEGFVLDHLSTTAVDSFLQRCTESCPQLWC